MDDIIFKCIECLTDDPTKFAKVRPNLCKPCKKNKRPYKCNECNDQNRENFIEGRYTICKKCMSMRNSNYNKEKRRQEKYESLEAKAGAGDEDEGSLQDDEDYEQNFRTEGLKASFGAKGLNSLGPRELKAQTLALSSNLWNRALKSIDLHIEKYLAKNTKLMNGYTIAEILENFSAYNIHKNNEDNIRDQEIDSLKNELAEIKFALSEIF